jgi:hypothetical protein
VATRFFQDLRVFSGKNGESLQDPYQIRQGAGTETSKIFPRLIRFIYLFIRVVAQLLVVRGFG